MSIKEQLIATTFFEVEEGSALHVKAFESGKPIFEGSCYHASSKAVHMVYVPSEDLEAVALNGESLYFDNEWLQKLGEEVCQHLLDAGVYDCWLMFHV